ncbi:hypothetical protein SAMN05216188_12785 [Lentzea xinjiangensis]|uniref:Uncharacterized protein n=1 Tax=Lentzea xinjiangensis TaxID=402600 RepID=A0A1H9VQ92_9PSEU|nr:hypothetical protein SAMN05216188_12785 [Lentzea xinjiangensis]
MVLFAEIPGRYDWIPDSPWILLLPAGLFAAAIAVKWWQRRRGQR